MAQPEDNNITSRAQAEQKRKPQGESPARRRCTLALTAFVYVLFHLAIGRNLAESARYTLIQMLGTAPFAMAFTIFLVSLHRHLSLQKHAPSVAGFLRIFFTMGIFFGLFFALYQHGGGDPLGGGLNASGFPWDIFRRQP